MDSEKGGLSSADRQRQTAAEIARNRVLAAYGVSNAPVNSAVIRPANNTNTTSSTTYKQNQVNPNVTQEEWKKYHSAWQKYYQKYYSEYYAQAARQYVETAKLKALRQMIEEGKKPDVEPEKPAVQPVQKIPGAITSTPDPEPEIKNRSEPESVLKITIREKADEHARKVRKHRRWIPIVAGITVVLFILFMQYNRLIFAPIMAYVSPGEAPSTDITPLDPTITQNVSPDPKLIIPKLNVEVPVHFGISNDNKTIMSAMNNGVAHWMISGANAFPGQIGNMVITGHSAGDIYSNNQYKFIFSGLERLDNGDLIYINYQSVRYTYRVTKKETVTPNNVGVLVYTTDKPMLTLVTCTPLGTSRYRLLVTAEQISPSYENSSSIDQTETPSDDYEMPANEQTFLEGIWSFLTNGG